MGVEEKKGKVFPYIFKFFRTNKIKIILQSSKRKKNYCEYLILKCMSNVWLAEVILWAFPRGA